MGDSQSSPVFYIGLNMPGAVSAGAYTAGVMDFLIDALDTWYAKREQQIAQYGNDYDRWEIPAHDVRLFVMAGASAGGMTSAIAATALCEEFTPVRSIPATTTNRLYKSWVTDIDINYLLGSDDLAAAGAIVESFLDSSRIDTIANNALQVTKPLATPRAYVADPLKVVLTLSNIKGIPYNIEENAGSAETQTLYHADYQSFQVSWTGAVSTAGALALDPRKPDGWPVLREVAKATGAFPFALKARALSRTTQQYELRQWVMPVENPGKTGQCEQLQRLPPAFGNIADQTFSTLNVDGGVTDNDPFACAYNELSQAPPAQPIGRHPTCARDADRAVISIAPFLSAPSFNLNAPLDSSLFGILPQLMTAVLDQSRITGENLQLTRNPDVFSAFHISPSIDDRTVNALASAALGAFGGFIDQKFRDHDYQLGRRNCQWFLQQYFGLPWDNTVMSNYAPQSQQARDRLDAEFGIQLPDGSRGVVLIPLLDDLRNEVTVVRTTIAQSALQPLAGQAAARIKLIASKLLDQYKANLITKTAFQAAWLILEAKVKNMLLSYAGKGLARQKLID